MDKTGELCSTARNLTSQRMESPAARKLRLALSLGGLDDTVDSQASTPARATISVRGLEERLEVLRRVATPEEDLGQTHGAVAQGRLPHLLPRRLQFCEDTADSTVSATLVAGGQVPLEWLITALECEHRRARLPKADVAEGPVVEHDEVGGLGGLCGCGGGASCAEAVGCGMPAPPNAPVEFGGLE